MSQQYIDIGAAPNDGQGNPIRDAFAKTNTNFTQLFLRYQAPPGNAIGVPGDVSGMYAFTANAIYYCYADYTGNSAIWASIPDVGNITEILNGTSNVSIATSDGTVTVWSDGTLVASFANTGQTVLGNVDATETITANILSAGVGNLQLANNTIYSNSDIVIDPHNDGGSAVGNVVVLGNLSVVGNVEYVDVTTSYTSNLLWVAAESANTTALANGAGLAVGPLGGFYSTLTYSDNESAWQSDVPLVPAANATLMLGSPTSWWDQGYVSTVNATEIQSSGNINTSANINAVGASFSGNISADNFTANVFVANALAANNLNLAGDLSAQNVNAIANLSGVDLLVSNEANVAGNIISAANINAVGANISGNVSGLNLLTIGIISAAGNVNTASNINAATANLSGDVLAVNANLTGVANAAHFSGEAGNISNVQWGNITGANAGIAANLAALGSNPVSTTGTITAGFLAGDGSNITNINAGNLVGGYGNANVAANLAAFGNNPVSTTGSISAGLFIGEGGNLSNITAANVAGTVSLAGNSIRANTANTVVDSAQPNITSVGTLTVVNTSGDVSAAGNITGNVFLGNGFGLASLVGANVTGTVANANYSAFAGNVVRANTANTVVDSAQPNITSVGTLTSINTSGAVSATGNITGNTFIGNGANLYSVVGANVTGTVPFAANSTRANTANTVVDSAQPNITSVGTLTSLSVSGNVTPGGIDTTGNISAGWFIGNGSQLTGLPAGYSNANATALLADLGSNVVSTTGNVTAAYFIGNGAVLSALTGANVTGTVPLAANSTRANTANTVVDSAQPNITSVGILTAINTSGAISATGNITGNVFLGNGAGLSSLVGANVTGTVALAGNSTRANTANTVVDSAQPNITSVGTLTALSVTGNLTAGGANLGAGNIEVGNVDATGVITATTFIGNFQGNISGNLVVPGSNTYVLFNDSGNAGASSGFTYNRANDVVNVANAIIAVHFLGEGGNVSNIQATNISGVVANANYAAFAGNSIRSNVSNTVIDSAQPNITSVGTLTSLSVSGNITPGAVSTTGNISAAYLIGNGSTLTGLPAGYANSDTAAFLADLGSNVVSTTGNITASYIIGNGSQLTGLPAGYSNANAAGFLAALGSNVISTTGNISGNVFLGNGSLLTGIPPGYGNANLANLGSNVISTTGNISGNVFLGNGSLLTGVSNYSNASLANIGANAISTTGNISAGYFVGNGSALTGIPSSAAVIGIEETANTAYYPVFTDATSGLMSSANIANTKLSFTPDTGVLAAQVLSAESGFNLNPTSITASYTIPTGYNAGSFGPITLASGVTVTIPAGSAWTIT